MTAWKFLEIKFSWNCSTMLIFKPKGLTVNALSRCWGWDEFLNVLHEILKHRRSRRIESASKISNNLRFWLLNIRRVRRFLCLQSNICKWDPKRTPGICLLLIGLEGTLPWTQSAKVLFCLVWSWIWSWKDKYEKNVLSSSIFQSVIASRSNWMQKS